MRMMIGYAAGAAGLAALPLLGQMSAPDVGAMIDAEMAAPTADPLIREAVQMTAGAVGTGANSAWVIITVAAMPVIFNVSKSLLAMLTEEHALSVAKRRKGAGLDPIAPE